MSEKQEKYKLKALCPTCYKIWEKEVIKELYEQIGMGNNLINQCDECRSQGKELDLEELQQVLEARREIGGFISEESIKEGLLWLKEEFPELYKQMEKMVLEQDKK